MTDMVSIPKETAQVLFDALVTSMDFGSGFLDTGEVEALRALAVAIGVDPLKGTPEEFATQYPHPFEAPDGRSEIAVLVGAADRLEGHWDGVWPNATWIDETVIDESRMPDYVPCKVGTWNRKCTKPETDPIHGGSS